MLFFCTEEVRRACGEAIGATATTTSLFALKPSPSSGTMPTNVAASLSSILPSALLFGDPVALCSFGVSLYQLPDTDEPSSTDAIATATSTETTTGAAAIAMANPVPSSTANGNVSAQCPYNVACFGGGGGGETVMRSMPVLPSVALASPDSRQIPIFLPIPSSAEGSDGTPASEPVDFHHSPPFPLYPTLAPSSEPVINAQPPHALHVPQLQQLLHQQLHHQCTTVTIKSLYELKIMKKYAVKAGPTVQRTSCTDISVTLANKTFIIGIQSLVGEVLIKRTSAWQQSVSQQPSFQTSLPNSEDENFTSEQQLSLAALPPTIKDYAVTEQFVIISQPSGSQGTLFLTNFRLLFVPNTGTDIIDIPLTIISRITSLGGQPVGAMERIFGAREGKPDDHTIEITTSPYYMNLQHPTVRFAFDSGCKEMCQLITQYSFPEPNMRQALSFSPPCTCKCCCCCACTCASCCGPVHSVSLNHSQHMSTIPRRANTTEHCPFCCIMTPSHFTTRTGAKNLSYDEVSEFTRQGVNLRDGIWRISTVNKDYGISATYPRVLVVPQNIDDDKLRIVANFRSKGRIPVLSWMHKSGAAITRGSQPQSGILTARCLEDERLINQICINTPTHKLYILDSRPLTNSVLNRALGGGYECSTYYGSPIEFLNMPNIHVVRDSFNRLHYLCMCLTSDPTCQTWLYQLSSTAWLDYIRLVLSGTRRIVSLVHEDNASVYVHCSDSWDRTSQLCALAEICMDPYYRTFEGFVVLIEKEWLKIGHKFNDRLREQSNAGSVSETSPIFLQFLDCIFQLMQQYPSAFQFNDSFLVSIMEEALIGRFGTFLGNCDRQRSQLAPSVVSLWDNLHHLQHPQRSLSQRLRYPKSGNSSNANCKSSIFPFVNPYYDPLYKDTITPMIGAHNLQLWTNYYFRLMPEGTDTMSIANDQRLYKFMEMKTLIRDLQHEIATLKGDPQQNSNATETEEHQPRTPQATTTVPRPNNTTETTEFWQGV
ncbi:myotubularin-related protein 1/2 [Pelomyxa schiedti]|nr:myotubularin-related protein 1/2 [Pelomyxa schiedti]